MCETCGRSREDVQQELKDLIIKQFSEVIQNTPLKEDTCTAFDFLSLTGVAMTFGMSQIRTITSELKDARKDLNDEDELEVLSGLVYVATEVKKLNKKNWDRCEIDFDKEVKRCEEKIEKLTLAKG